MPIEDIQSFKVICRGGLNSNKNILDLSDNYPGMGTVLQNFEPSLFGGYRRLEGYEPLEESFPEITNGGDASGKILGVFIYNEDVYAARADGTGTNYNIFLWNPGADWTVVAGMPTRPMSAGGQTVNKIRYDTWNFDGTEKIGFVDGVNNFMFWDGTTFTEVDPTVELQALEAPKYISVFANHILVSSDATTPQVVAHSAPLDESQWNSGDGAGQIFAGFAVKQIKPFRDACYVFGVNHIKKITVNNGTFVINDVTKRLGTQASDSVQEIAGDLIFLSQDGFRSIAGTERIDDVELGALSKDIQQDINTLYDPSLADEIDTVVIRSKSQYRMFFNDSTVEAENTFGIIGGLKGGMNGIVWEWARTLGIRTSSCTSEYIGSQEFVIAGDYNGKVYRQEQGNGFDGRNIHAIYATPYLDFGDTQIRKTYRYISVFLRPEGSVTLDTAVRFDWGNFGIINPDNYTLQSVGTPPVWGEVVWGQFNYGNSGTIPVNVSPMEGSAFAVQFEFSSDDMNAPYSIQGIVVEYTANGRK